MTSEAIQNQEKIREIRKQFYSGLVTYQEAKRLAQPVIDNMNDKAKEIAKKYNKKPQRFDFTNLMR